MRPQITTLAALAAIALAGAPSAQAVVWWYAGGDVPAGYLAAPGSHAGGLAHINDSAIGGDIDNLEPGDYCSIYDLPHPSRYSPYTGDASYYTGLSVPSPFENWQLADTNGSICQAQGSHWGLKMRGGDSTGLCDGDSSKGHWPCGAHHYVSFRGQNLHPWDSSSGIPATSLVISTDVGPQSAGQSRGSWGYVCPVLEDTTTGYMLEYCVAEWKQGSGVPAASMDTAAACAQTPSGRIVDQVITDFNAGRGMASLRGTSSTTYAYDPTQAAPGRRWFSAAITPTNLRNAVQAVSGRCGRPNPSYDATQYVLYGVEQGIEGLSGSVLWLGASSTSLTLGSTTDALYQGETLMPGHQLTSPNGRYLARMQEDGNFVVYDTNNWSAIWASWTQNHPGARLVLQGDGNMVIYDTNGSPLWYTTTQPSTSDTLQMQDDANLVLYSGRSAIWHTR